jgi:LmbE family N-acetylglucosaminyl deacetylase
MLLNKVFIPDGTNPDEALKNTTDLCIVAHPDDIEIMAYHAVAECYGKDDRHFTGVVVTDGGGSPRSGVYANYTDNEMIAVRAEEQKNAARIGRYCAQFLLSHPSSAVKDPNNRTLIEELKYIIRACAPNVLYMHNLADKHDTHVALALRVITALRELDLSQRPKKIIAMEAWRALDWLCDEDKLVFDSGLYPNLSDALIALHDSQISGGKRYDLAIQGRRKANATFLASHDTDHLQSAALGMDLTPLINNNIDPTQFITTQIENLKNDITARIAKFL